MRTTDNWIYFDWICLFLILATICTNVLFFLEYGVLWKKINNRTSIVMLLILWLRLFKYARPFENAGLSRLSFIRASNMMLPYNFFTMNR